VTAEEKGGIGGKFGWDEFVEKKGEEKLISGG